ncbi:MAG: type I glyceraldehyde-3-phosphate dehydrogenase [Deltaproteobacteria bacterium]|nr:type I glyceraldehyde-3-phosphate dehydrogenase [Deltaproteobacteria bacterium]
MGIKVGINGFGRIGRNVMRAILNKGADIDVLAANDLGEPAQLAHLLKYDTVHGTLKEDVTVEGDIVRVGNKKIKVLKVAGDITTLPWKDLGVDVVVESTGRCKDRDAAAKHLTAGAKKVIISAPAKKVDGTFVLGVNEGTYDPKAHHVISNASCTTNCLAPMASVLHKNFGIIRGLMTTIHSYTMDQRLLDNLHSDWRRARSAAMAMIPTTTGAATAVGLVLPELKGKLDGLSIRVPTPNVSLVDLVVDVTKDVTIEDVNNAVRTAAEGPLKGIIHYNTAPLVSSDFNTTTYSCVFDAPLTSVMENRMVKVLAWYDNEFGYSSRMTDLIEYVGKRLS